MFPETSHHFVEQCCVVLLTRLRWSDGRLGDSDKSSSPQLSSTCLQLAVSSRDGFLFCRTIHKTNAVLSRLALQCLIVCSHAARQ
jgi:hypothetical protein